MMDFHRQDFNTFVVIIKMLFDVVPVLYFHGPVMENLVKAQFTNDSKLYIHTRSPLDSCTTKVIAKELVRIGCDVVCVESYSTFTMTKKTRCKKISLCFGENKKRINLIFHCGGLDEVLFDTDNIALSRNYLSIIKTPENDDKIPSLSLIEALYSNARDEVRLVNNLTHEQHDAVLDTLSMQDKMTKRGKHVIKGYGVGGEGDCSICYTTNCIHALKCGHVFCSSCIDKHLCSTKLAHNKDCPVCRQVISFEVNEK